jgi:hypothetical protein
MEANRFQALKTEAPGIQIAHLYIDVLSGGDQNA